ncbi:hypothetical protein A3709_20715 [Halioglobus sp. HI00S01]|uniref:peptidase domain-containing ABC transporter n=1 Tax=Halioglobus sp. HI00S01 TaxID=1822214 RepID=UPI0007C222EF|nr:peptidase domain-containing ABC transporter [Halioglobus sp. HI00S01]KZX58037.1 hypothetical protein A3709_20715 [Halioglobus sp. HI00S01]
MELSDLLRASKTPVILQSEVAECGLAALAMVAGHYGLKLELHQWRSRVGASAHGMSIHDIREAADAHGMQARVLRVEIGSLEDIQLPAILHWEMKHFVVLDKIVRGKLHIIDPGYGTRVMTYDEVSDHYTGLLLELMPGNDFQKVDARAAMRIRDLWGHLVGWKSALGKVLLMSLFIQLSALAVPYFMQIGLDHVVVSDDGNLLLSLGLAFAGLAALNALVSLIRARVIVEAAALLDFQMASNLFTHLLKLPLPYFQSRQMGDLISRFGSLRSIRERMTTSLIEAMVDGAFSVIVLVAMIAYSPALSLAVIVPLVLLVGLRVFLYGSYKRRSEEQIVNSAKEQTHLIESIRGIQTIKLYAIGSERRSVWRNYYGKAVNSGVRLGFLDGWMVSGESLLSGLSHVLVVFFGLTAVLDGSITVGVLVAFLAYAVSFRSRIITLVENLFTFKLISVDLQRVGDIVQTRAEPASDEQIAVTDGEITLHELGFQHTPTSPFLFRGVNLTIRPGESVAFAGPSGCGKSTMVKILAGLYEATEGDVLIDGVTIRPGNTHSLRRQVATVMQDDQLFNGSILENITLSDMKPDEDRAIECAKLASIWPEIEAMPMGMETILGEGGGMISGGQQQRILLARAFYRQAKIIILDEATSHLDVHNEMHVNQSIRDMNMTRIVVAHRMETIASCDRLVSFEPEGLVDRTDEFREQLRLVANQ